MPGTCQILIVEDDRAIARVLQRSLQREGLVVQVANDGWEAKSALEDNHFDFVLCDYQLPDTTGAALCRHIRLTTSHQDVPIALCTAKAHEVDVAALTVELGLSRIFSKPFSVREIAAEICRSVGVIQ